jgi:hypothetical protein
MGVKLGLSHHGNVRELGGDEIILTKEIENNRKMDKNEKVGPSWLETCNCESNDGLVCKNMARHANMRFQLPFPITYASIFELGEYLIT